MLIFIWISFALKILLKITEEEAIVISIFGTGLLTYIFGILELLWISTYIIGILALVSMLYVIKRLIKKQEKLKSLMTLPMIIYIIVMFLVYYSVRDIKFAYYDEFMFWGTNLKTMLDKSCLWANAHVDGIHLIYPPFTAIIEYLFCKFSGKFQEGIAYYGIITLIFTAIMPLLKNEKYQLKSFAKTVIIFMVTYSTIHFFQFELTNLAVDCILGIIFAVLMYLVYSQKHKKDYIVITILLASITLVKTNGILFAGIAVLQLFFQKIIFLWQHRKKKEKKSLLKQFSIIGILLLITIITSLSWKGYYTINGKKIDDRHDKNSVENINVKDFLTAITFQKNADSRQKKIVSNFFNNLKHVKITTTNIGNTVLFLFGLINIVYIILIITKKKKERAIANLFSMNIGFVLYIISNIVMFMFVFQKDQGEMLMGFERYLSTYMLAMILNLIYCMLETANIKVILFVGIYSLLIYSKSQQIPLRPQRNIINIENATDIISHVNKNKKVYIIDQSLDYGYDFVMTRFLIAPIKTNLLYEWNISHTTEGIYYKMAISSEDFKKKLLAENYDFIYFIHIEEKFLKEYNDILTIEAKEKLNSIVGSRIKTNGILLDVKKDIVW